MEVGIEDSLHIEFEYNKSKYVVDFLYLNVILMLAQVSSKGCHCRKDLLLACTNQDQAHGAVHYSPRNNRVAAEPVQRERNNHQVRDHGWRTSARWVVKELVCVLSVH